MQVFAHSSHDLRTDLPRRAIGDAEDLGPVHFRLFKRTVDVCLAVIALPVIALVGLALAVVNPFLNPGPVFFLQYRMGRGGRPFKVIKFRTMRPTADNLRSHDEPLELHRITPLGAVLRRFRIDEIPNFLNVLVGEMSVIGPRPDAFDHARIYAARIPRYEVRYRMKPGITGLAQVRAGYADSTRGVQRKAHYDHFYVCQQSVKLDLFIMRETVRVIASGFGAK